MKRIHISQVKPNTVINQAIYDQHFNLLVNKGTSLNEKLIESIKYYGYSSVYVMADDFRATRGDELPHDNIQMLIKLLRKNYMEFEVYLNRRNSSNTIALYKKYSIQRDLFIEQMQKITEDIILFFVKNQINSLQILESKSIHLYSIQHGIQAGLLSILIGIKMKLKMTELKLLFTSALMMEFSNVIVPKEILTKKGLLTKDEYTLLKRHTDFCYEEFNDCRYLHFLVKIITQQHHERYDGSGYPKGLSGEMIHPLARILNVADAFDALTSDRNQRAAYSIAEALEIIASQSGKHYQKEVVTALKSVVFPYAIGEAVTLNVGPGIVIGYDDSFNPIVELSVLKKRVILTGDSQIKITAHSFI